MYVQLMMSGRLKYNCATGAPAKMVHAAGITMDSKILTYLLHGAESFLRS